MERGLVPSTHLITRIFVDRVDTYRAVACEPVEKVFATVHSKLVTCSACRRWINNNRAEVTSFERAVNPTLYRSRV